MTRIVAFLLVILSGAAQAEPFGKPVLLVASPDMQGPYAQTVLIAVPVGEEHLGFIVNRATEVKLATLFPAHAPSAKVADPVYFGGPEMAEAVFAVVRRNPGAEAVRLVGEAFLVTDAEAVDRIIERTPNDARYFAGFVGWQPGELAKEIDAGYWHVTDADPAVFWQDNHGLWQQLVERLANGHAPQRGRGFHSAGLQDALQN
jgi:putative transcriptional regulator